MTDSRAARPSDPDSRAEQPSADSTGKEKLVPSGSLSATQASADTQRVGTRPVTADDGRGTASSSGALKGRDSSTDEAKPAADDAGGRAAPRAEIPRDRIAMSIAAVVAALSLLWLAGESHYRSCIDSVQVRNSGGGDALTRLARQEGLDRCSRLPF